MPAKQKAKKLPGASYLNPFSAVRGDKCSCKSPNAMKPSGMWVVDDYGTFYTFDPNTQLQKDIWLGTAERSIGKSEAMAMLRWYCFTCQTVQVP